VLNFDSQPDHQPVISNENRPALVAVVNSSIALNFLQGQLDYFQSLGYDVAAVCPPRRSDEWEIARPDHVCTVRLPMRREIAPWDDLLCLWRLWRLMRFLRPAISNVGTPKAGLLGGVAAWLNRVPCRFYTLHGLRFETTRGVTRWLLVAAERLACRFAHRVICVSKSVREKALASGLTTPDRAVVLGSGSCNGVDVARFAPSHDTQMRAERLRTELSIPADAPVVLFVGRLTRDKGIPELAQAFAQLLPRFPELRLVLVGCFEKGDPLPQHTRQFLETHPSVVFAGAVEDTPAFYAMADIVVLPSHREGLPTVVLEAFAAGKPVIGAAATGIVDLITAGETGLLFPVGDGQVLAAAVTRVLRDRDLGRRLGLAGQDLVKQNFTQQQVWDALRREYLSVLQAHEDLRLLTPSTNNGDGWLTRSNR
jgi:glycosyltransferase involved in cell wall biosynthesis